jgi:uncharacterized protein (TIGR00369 family)
MDSNIANPFRSRTVSWQNSELSRRNAAAMTGLDYLRGIRDGAIAPPPAAALVNYRILEIEEGRSVFELAPDESQYNPFGTVHGGIACTLLDTCITSAVLSTLPVGQACSTLEIKVNFIRPISEATGPVRGEARVIHGGREVATASGEIRDAAGKLYAHAVGTMAVFSVPSVR